MRKMSKEEFVLRMMDDSRVRRKIIESEPLAYFRDKQKRRMKWKKRNQTR